MNINRHFNKITWILITCLLFNIDIYSQNTDKSFGKSRIQYENKNWKQYNSDNFTIYWQGEDYTLAESTIQLAEWDFRDIQEILEHRINDVIEIVIYNDLLDFQQSNLHSDEPLTNIGGHTQLREKKMSIYFNGNHQDLRKEIRSGISRVYIENLITGNSLQEIVQNAVLLNLPLWFSEGLIAYCGEKWNPELDDRLRNIILSKKYTDFESFAKAEPELAGHSLWYYIDVQYGQALVSNLIYLTRINRSVQGGFLYVLGVPYERAIRNWDSFYKSRYAGEINIPSDSLEVPLELKKSIGNLKNNTIITEIKLSPDGKNIAYVTNLLGKIKVFVQNIKTGEQKVIMQYGLKNKSTITDNSYPLIAWSGNNQTLAILYEKAEQIIVQQINTKTNENKENLLSKRDYDRVTSIEYYGLNALLMSASYQGQSDIYIHQINSDNIDKLTDEIFDNLDPSISFLNGEKGVLFSSNRGEFLGRSGYIKDSVLTFNSFDIYFLPLENREKELIRITKTPYSNERSPIGLDSTCYAFLSDQNGIYNMYMGALESYVFSEEKKVFFKDGTSISFHKDSIYQIDYDEVDTMYIEVIKKMRGSNVAVSNYHRNIAHLSPAKKTNEYLLGFNSIGNHLKAYKDNFDINYKSTIQNNKASSSGGVLLNTHFKQEYLQSKKEEIEASLIESKKEIGEPAVWQFEYGFTEEEDKDSLDTKEDKSLDYFFVVDYLEETDDINTSQQNPVDENNQEEEIIDIENYTFESDFEPEKDDTSVIVEDEDGRKVFEDNPVVNNVYDEFVIRDRKKVHQLNTGKVKDYGLKFQYKSVTVQLDNSLIYGGLDVFTGLENTYYLPDLSIKSSIKDVLENYILEAGMRIPTTFNGLEFFVNFQDKKKRLDKKYSYYRSSNVTSINNIYASVVPSRIKTSSDLAQVELTYPLNAFNKIRGRSYIRNDRMIRYQSTDTLMVNREFQNQRIGLGLEYVYDNTQNVHLNIKNGTRIKIFSDVSQKMDVQFFEDFKWQFNGMMYNIGADLRHYQPLSKKVIFASRFSFATSFGADKILYYLGATENPLFSPMNSNIPLPDYDEDFTYQTLAGQLRGFRYNIRNGNSFAFANFELRIPLFSNLKIRSGIIRNLQLVGFYDVGTAWRGVSPFNKNNPLNTSVINAPEGTPQVISVTVNYYRDPIVSGFGGGIRTKLFGYFLRVDYARGIETRQLMPPVWHVSLGTDF